jgi:hypothetical protein
MYGLFYEGERCPDGVELFDYRFRGGKQNRRIRYRTARREPFRWEIENLENPIVIDFINAREDAERIRFLSKFGLLHHEGPYPDALPRKHPGVTGQPYEHLVRAQDEFRGNLDSINHLKQAELLAEINKSFESGPPNLQPWLDLATAKGTPRMLLRCKSLGDFMHMEAVTAAVLGAKMATCEHCGAAFLTGPLTGRRSHAKYCSDRCRVAAMRARNQASAAT